MFLILKKWKKNIKPKAPFTTSKLQQAAANRLGFTSKKTMQIAQQLYEGINIGNTRVGLISYMRTDSVRVSPVALEEIRAWISANYPAELPPTPVEYTIEKKAQDAHEAIRPTYVAYTPDSIKEHLTRDQYKLYAIIWERLVSSQMNAAKSRTTSLDISCGQAVFRISGSRLVEKGFYKVLKTLTSKEDKETPLPELHVQEKLDVLKYDPQQHFTQGAPRYTDATIVKTLEELGIGRPSTYAPIISVLLERYYVTRSNKQLVPTILGRKINDMLVEYFPTIVDTSFTADLETKLDEVEENTIKWPQLIEKFYTPFKETVDEVSKTIEPFKGSMDEVTDYTCELCGRPMVKKLGPFWLFFSLPGFSGMPQY